MKDQKNSRAHDQPMTYEEYAGLPDDGFRYELVGQQLDVMSPTPSVLHQLVVSAMRDVLLKTCEAEYLIVLSPVDVVFSSRDVRQPDLVMVHRERMGIVHVKGIFGVPDLIVEVLSPGSFERDRKEKWKTYEAYQVPEYWLVDSLNGTVEQYEYTNGQLHLCAVYEAHQPIYSVRLPCVSFTMSSILLTLPKLTE
ncbi:Uma2 family endonuclease [Ferroacidibacillus organovorans]|nr:Uma2 family endonuclease [Ferroacidibacillus organovorans]